MLEESSDEVPSGSAVTAMSLLCLVVGVLVGGIYWMDCLFAENPRGLHAVLCNGDPYVPFVIAFVLPALVLMAGSVARKDAGSTFFKRAWASALVLDLVLFVTLFVATA